MKSFPIILALAAAGLANPLVDQYAPTCNADNCARAVTGTAFGSSTVASHLADCSSFLKTTVIAPAPTTTVTITPAAVTATVTIFTLVSDFSTVTTTVFVGQKRAAGTASTVIPSAVPSYASACSGTARYSSACSCFGLTGSTVTATFDAVTSTVTGKASTVTVTNVEPVTTDVVVVATQTNGPGPRPSCGSTVQGNGGCNCGYLIACNTRFNGTEVLVRQSGVSEQGCVDLCDHYNNAFVADYARGNGTCTIYRSTSIGSAVALVDDDYFSFQPGSCGAIGPQGCVVG